MTKGVGVYYTNISSSETNKVPSIFVFKLCFTQHHKGVDTGSIAFNLQMS